MSAGTSSRRWPFVVAGLLVVAAVAAVWPLGSAAPFASSWGRWLDHGVAVAFVAAGILASLHRRHSPLGPLMIGVAAVWLMHSLVLTRTPALFTAALLTELLFLPLLAYTVLAFPRGRLRHIRERAVVAAFAAAWILDSSFALFYDPSAFGCPDCQPGLNLVMLESRPDLVEAKADVLPFVITLALVFLVLELVHRYVRATSVARRVVGPLYLPILVWAFAYALYMHIPRVGNTNFLAGAPLDQVLLHTLLASLMLVPVMVLVGIQRARGRRGRIGGLVRELGEMPSLDRLERALARTLEDPQLRLGLRSGEGFLTPDLRPLDLPDPNGPTTATLLERRGSVVAALVHDRALLLDDRELLEAVTSAARLAVENDRLQEEVRERLAEVRASRARIVQASDDTRREIERNIHDGAQQRLVSLLVGLRLAEIQVGDDADPALRGALVEMADQLNEAIEELRELARGLHPAVLTDEGLGAAVEGLAQRASIPVEVEAVPDERLAAPVEAAAYFVVAEGVTNAAKHGRASHVRVAIRCVGRDLVVEIVDDGVGGAEPADGSGLAGLQDRVAALDGSLELESPPGAGTTIRATLPAQTAQRGAVADAVADAGA